MSLKYTAEEIKWLARTRLVLCFTEPQMKKGLIAECCFTMPNGNKHSWVEACFPMYEENHDRQIAQEILRERALNKCWEICGQYTLATGEKMQIPENCTCYTDDNIEEIKGK